MESDSIKFLEYFSIGLILFGLIVAVLVKIEEIKSKGDTNENS